MSEEGLRLGTVFYDGFELLDVYGPLEMFAWTVPEMTLVSVDAEAGPVAPVKGPATVVDHSFGDCPELDVLLVPGGAGTFAALADDRLSDFIRARCEHADLVLSVCTGSALLAKAGVLDGHSATSNKQFFNLAVSQSERVDWITHARWVTSGKFWTSSGVSAGMDMALSVIASLYGDGEANRVAALTEYERAADPNDDPFVGHLNELMPDVTS